MPGAPGMPGDPGSDSGQTGTAGPSGPSGPPGSSQLPDIGGGGLPGVPGSAGGKPGESGEEGKQGEEGGKAGDQEQAGDGTNQLPTWDNQKGNGKGEWETSNQIPEVPVDITRGNGKSGNGPPGKGDEPGKSGAAGELDDVLKDIDGGIMAERSEIKNRAGAVPGDGSEQRAGGAMPGSPGSTAAAGSAGAASAGNPSEISGMPDGIPTVANAPKAPRKGAGVPNDVADARDDDIISRQLREAAMQEEDPEIREKLWEDYRRYKGH